jgi:tetratricopeptide (TPR) repeat protein
MFTHIRISPILLIAAALLLSGAGAALAGVPKEFTNLKVLPKDVGKRQLLDAMKDFTQALGQRCEFCHVQKIEGDFDSIDWASDENKHKNVAREMMKMANTINSDLLPESDEGKLRVKCVTCHRGLKNPATLYQVLMDDYEDGGALSLSASYMELRDEYYGTGSYNFSPDTLATMAEFVGRRRDDLEGAITLLEVNIALYPQHISSHLMMTQAYKVKGDKPAALAALEKALEIDPEHAHAQKMVRSLERMK